MGVCHRESVRKIEQIVRVDQCRFRFGIGLGEGAGETRVARFPLGLSGQQPSAVILHIIDLRLQAQERLHGLEPLAGHFLLAAWVGVRQSKVSVSGCCGFSLKFS